MNINKQENIDLFIEVLPDFFTVKNGKLFFTDSNIYPNPLYIDQSTYAGYAVYLLNEYQEYAKSFNIMYLRIDTQNKQFKAGWVSQLDDVEFSHETILGIFKNNIDINTLNGYAKYDREAFMREITINDILE